MMGFGSWAHLRYLRGPHAESVIMIQPTAGCGWAGTQGWGVDDRRKASLTKKTAVTN